jgi:tetratricopeptide (TPR) repeat protein
MKMGRWAEAREALSTAYARSPRSPRLVTAAAIAQLHTEGPESAKSYLLYALNLDPLYPPALYDMALVNNDWLKDDAEAEKYFKKYLEVAGRDIPAADARRALKALQADRARRTVAVPAADAARAASRAPPVNPPAVEEAMKRTRAAIQREDFDEALMRLKETVSHYDRNADALWELALLYDRNLDDPAHAVETYQAFLGAFPNDPRARDARLRLARLAPVPPGGRQAPDVTPRASAAPASDIPPMSQLRFRKPARPDPRVAVEAYNMGNRYQKAGDWNRAIFYYTRAIENDDMFLNAYLNLGYTYRSSGDPQRARDAFAGALRIQPDLAKARYALALACRDLRQNADAIRHLSAALNADPGYADAHLLLGQMYQQTGGNTDRVRMHYLKYVELCPTGAVAPQVTKWLEYHEGR